MNRIIFGIFQKFRDPSSYWTALASNYGVMVVTGVVQLVLIPVYISRLGIGGFGVVTTFLSLVDFAFVGIVWLCGGSARIMAECAAHDDWIGFSRVYSLTSVLFTGIGVLIALIFLIGVILFKKHLVLYIGVLDGDLFWLTIFSVSILVVTQFKLHFEQLALAAIKRHWAGNLLQAVNSFLLVILVFYSLSLKSDAFLVFLCMVVSLFCANILAWAYWRWGSGIPVQFIWPRRSSLPLLKRLVGNMGIGYATWGILESIRQHIYILLVAWVGGSQAVGMLSLLMKVPNLCVQLMGRIAKTAEPYFIHYDTKGEHDRLTLFYQRGLRWAVGGSFFLGLLFALFGRWLLGLWVGIDKVPNTSLPYWLAGMAAFWISAVRWPISHVYALVDIGRLNGVLFIEVLVKLILIVILFDRTNYLAPLWAVNLEFILGVFILYVWLGGTVRKGYKSTCGTYFIC